MEIEPLTGSNDEAIISNRFPLVALLALAVAGFITILTEALPAGLCAAKQHAKRAGSGGADQPALRAGRSARWSRYAGGSGDGHRSRSAGIAGWDGPTDRKSYLFGRSAGSRDCQPGPDDAARIPLRPPGGHCDRGCPEHEDQFRSARPDRWACDPECL